MNSKTITNTRIGISIICIIAFFPVFNSGFVNYDDPEYILNNHYIKHFSIENIKYIFLSKTTDLYVPLTVFSYLIEHSLFGGNPKAFHSINLLLHIINTLLLLQILLKLNIKHQYLIYFILLFFALNPLVTESVCWITERKDVLYCFFYFLSIIQFINYFQKQNFKYICLSFVFFILSCLSKPMAVSLPALFSLYIIYTSQKIDYKKHVVLIPFYLGSVLFSVISVFAIKNLGEAKISINTYNLIEKLIVLISELGYYFIKPFIPFNQSLFHLFPKKTELFQNSSILIYAILFLIILCSVYYFTIKKGNKLIGFLFFSWIIFLVPILQIYVNTHSYVSERYFYVSIIFPVIIIFIMIQSLKISVKIYQISFILLLITFTILTFKRSKIWANTLTLFEQEIKLNYKNHIALNNLGYYYNTKENYKKAMPYLQQAVAIEKDNSLYLNNYGWALSRSGQMDSAIIYLERSLSINTKSVDALSNMGICYIQKKQREKALPYFKKAYELNPNNPDVLCNLGIYYFNSGMKTEALPLLQKAEKLGNTKATKYLLRM